MAANAAYKKPKQKAAPKSRQAVEKEVEEVVQERAASKRVRVRKTFHGEDTASEQPPPKRAKQIKKAQHSLDHLASVVADEVGKPAAAEPTEKPDAPSAEDIQAEMLEMDASDAEPEAPDEDEQQEQGKDKESDEDSDEEDLGMASEDWTLDFLAALNPDEVIGGTSAQPIYAMTVHQIKAERRLRGDKKVAKHPNHKPHSKKLLALRAKDSKSEKDREDEAEMNPENWDADEQEEDAKGTRRRWSLHDAAALPLILEHPKAVGMLSLIAKGYEVSKETKRLDMDERVKPWPIIAALWSSGEILTSPFANHDTLGLKFMDPNQRYLGWGSEAIKKRYGLLRTAGSVVSPPFSNTGQNDPEALPNYLHFADHIISNRKILQVAAYMPESICPLRSPHSPPVCCQYSLTIMYGSPNLPIYLRTMPDCAQLNFHAAGLEHLKQLCRANNLKKTTPGSKVRWFAQWLGCGSHLSVFRQRVLKFAGWSLALLKSLQ